MFATDIPQ